MTIIGEEMPTEICGVEQPKRIWLFTYRHAGDVCWSSDPNPEDADEIETVEYVRADHGSPEVVTDEMIKAGVKAMQLNYGTREYPPPGTVEAIYEAMRVAALSKVTVV